MSEEEQIDNPTDPLAEKKLRKIELEIKNLENQVKWDGRVAKFLPFITTLVAVGGLLLTFWQSREAQRKESEQRYHNEKLTREQQEKERINRIQSQIRVDKEQLLEFIASDQPTSRAIFLLDDLGALIEQIPAKDTEEKNITGLLVHAVWELHFDKQRDIYFETLLLSRWRPYREQWKANPSAHQVLLSKQYAQMERVYKQDRDCISNLRYDEQRKRYVSSNANTGCEDGLFPILLYSFKKHLQVIEEMRDWNLFEQERTKPSQLTGNPAFTLELSK